VSHTPNSDASTDRLLRQALRPPSSAAPSEACLDAETLAAWMSGNLSGTRMDEARTHLADCAHCQAVLATMARIEPSLNAGAPERGVRRWWAWMVPLTAAAAALFIWIALPRDRTVTTPAVEQQTALADAKARLQAAPPPPAVASSKDQAANVAPEKKLEELRTTPVTEPKPAAPTAAAPVAPAPAQAPVTAPVPAERDLGRLNERVAKLAAPPIIITSPDAMIRWRVTGATVERSIDSGSTWKPTSSGITSDLTAGAAPSSSVCWLVGRGGVVLLSTDGSTWRRVAFPDTTDLSAVRATDAQSAVVTTSDGRTFATTNGGVSWVRQPLQEN
jgi:hypothetical protein